MTPLASFFNAYFACKWNEIASRNNLSFDIQMGNKYMGNRWELVANIDEI